MSVAAEMRAAMEETRADTLRLFAEVDEVDFRRQVHPDFSPLGWHLGHIGVTEAFWLLQQCQGLPSLSLTHERFFTPTDTPKPERGGLPPRAAILAYLATVRERVWDLLATANFATDHALLQNGGIFNMVLQHEQQHLETITVIRQLLAADAFARAPQFLTQAAGEPSTVAAGEPELIAVPAGMFLLGSSERAVTLDNERPQHEVFVKAFHIARLPVTNGDFLRFIEAGGSRERRWWSEPGWAWVQQVHAGHPSYWRCVAGRWREIQLAGAVLMRLEQPVRCINWYEADAYARFAGKRLPSEAEWECAAAAGILEGIGQSWEWTATWFAPYPGFSAHPYDGYSVPYFDGQHRVLRGGSWATRRHVQRHTCRNWYRPWVREIFAGLRCARDD